MNIYKLTLCLTLATLISAPIAPTQQASEQDKKRLTTLKPTLEEIKKVDPTLMPWGVNLSLVEERGDNARKMTLDKFDFSSRITLYQKHKSKAIKLANEIGALSKLLKNANDSLAKIGTPTSRNKKERTSLEQNIEAIQTEINLKKADIKKNAVHLQTFKKVIIDTVGLTEEQIKQLPDIETWKKMKENRGGQMTPKAVSPPNKTIVGRPRARLAPPPPPRIKVNEPSTVIAE